MPTGSESPATRRGHGHEPQPDVLATATSGTGITLSHPESAIRLHAGPKLITLSDQDWGGGQCASIYRLKDRDLGHVPHQSAED